MVEINTAPTFDQACEIIKNCNEESLKDIKKDIIKVEMDRMLTFDQACSKARCTEEELKNLIESGRIRPFLTDGYYLISEWGLEQCCDKLF